MNWANRVTLIRILLIPVIVILMILHDFDGRVVGFFPVLKQTIDIGGLVFIPVSYLIAGVLFIIASLTDALDGAIARKYNLVTTFGKFFDAIADKLLTNVVLIMFGVANIVPVWIVIILIARDFVIDVVRQILAAEKTIMSANKLGKYKSATEMVGMTILFFIGHIMINPTSNLAGEYNWLNQVIMIPMYITVVLSIISALNYIYLNRKILLDTSSQKTGLVSPHSKTTDPVKENKVIKDETTKTKK